MGFSDATPSHYDCLSHGWTSCAMWGSVPNFLIGLLALGNMIALDASWEVALKV